VLRPWPPPFMSISSGGLAGSWIWECRLACSARRFLARFPRCNGVVAPNVDATTP
jgi:hypothetical protein